MNRGFTLIELLVVIAIIGILASVVLASLNDARATAQDSAQISIFRQIQTSLELYYNANGQYPGDGRHYYSRPECGPTTPNGNWTDVFNASYDQYMNVPESSPLGCMIYSTSSTTAWRCYPQASGNANEINPSNYQYFLVMPTSGNISYEDYPRFNSTSQQRCILGPRR